MNDTWLVHHGILGQKWGVRRFQNKDGSLTEAGKKHIADQKNHKFGSYEDEKATAQKLGDNAFKMYKRLSTQLDEGKISEDQYYEDMQKKVYDPLINAGYEWVNRGGGSDGFLQLQFGRELSDVEIEERNGEEWVQEWIMNTDWPEIQDPEKDW